MGAPFSLLGKPAAFARDFPRDAMPAGYLWDLVDYVPALINANLVGRGGWQWASNSLGSDVQHGILATLVSTDGSFTSSDRLIVEGSADINTVGTFYEVNQSTGAFTAVSGGSAPPSLQNMVQLGQEVITLSDVGNYGPIVIVLRADGTLVACSAWTGEIPPRRACVYGGMLVHGASHLPPGRDSELRTVRFSVPGESFIDSTRGIYHETRTITRVGTYGASGTGIDVSAPLTYAHHGPPSTGEVPKTYHGAPVVANTGTTTTLAAASLAGATTLKLEPLTAADGFRFKDGDAIVGMTNGMTVDIDSGFNVASYDVNSFIITSAEITALAATRAVVIVFHKSSAERIRNNIPPHTDDVTKEAAEGNMVLEPLFDDLGCNDPKSIAYWNDNVLFANDRGVHMTDGATVTNLCSQGGILTYWRSIYANRKSVSAGVYLDYYIVTVIHNDGSYTTLLCNLPQRQWIRFSNIKALTYIASGTALSADEMWVGLAGAGRLARLSPCFSPVFSGSLIADDNAVNVLPSFETAYYRLVFARALGHRLVQEEGRSRIRFGYLSYDARGSGTPPLSIDYLLTPEGSYQNSGVFPATTDYTRHRFPVNKFPFGIAFRVQQVAATSALRIYDLGVDSTPSERSRL